MNKVRVETDFLSRYKNDVIFNLQTTPARSIATTAHIHDAIEILYVQQGSFTVYADDDEYKIFAGDIILFRSNVIHHVFAGEQKINSYYVLTISPDLIRSIAPAEMCGTYLLNFTFKRNNSKCLWRKSETEGMKEVLYGFSLLENEFPSDEKYSDIGVKLAAGGVLLGLLRHGADDGEQNVYNATDRTAECIYKAMTYINRNYKEDITEEDVCSDVGMSQSYFSRTFKLVTGKSFKQYLNITRINHAERLLATTNKTVSDICFECGYNDVSYFIKVYREHKSVPPGASKTLSRRV